MNATLLNGRARKTLAQQLDRMDTMLDGLSEGLNEAVATAATASMREVVCLAVQQAVRTTLAEILSNAEVQNRLAPRSTPVGGSVVALVLGGWSKLVALAKQAWNSLKGTATPTVSAVSAAAKDMVSGTSETVTRIGQQIAKKARQGWMLATVLAALAKQYRFHLAASLAVGAVIGLACWLGGREVASVGCGLSGFAGSLATRAVHRRGTDYLANFQS